MNISERLCELSDKKYKEFQGALLPTVDPQRIIGIRIPLLRRFAKEIRDSAEAEAFLSSLPHRYYDENNLHAFLICESKSLDECYERLEAFLPYIDNWATCDSLSPSIIKSDKARLLTAIKRWIKSDHVYTVRFAVCMLMRHFLDEDFEAEQLEAVCKVQHDGYYVKMAVAWYFATALAKQYNSAVKYIKNCRLDKWTHNKAIQKSLESYRITPEQKIYLKKLKK